MGKGRGMEMWISDSSLRFELGILLGYRKSQQNPFKLLEPQPKAVLQEPGSWTF